MVNWVTRGRVAWVFEDSFVPDAIMGADNILVTDPEKLKSLAMKGFEADFVQKVKPGDFFVGGRNYGYARAHAPVSITMQALNLSGVIAESFAPGYLGSSVNNAYPLLLECPGITKKVKRWDELEADFKRGVVRNMTTGETIRGQPLPQDAVELIEAGGLLSILEKKLKGVAGPPQMIGF
ncbi:MAG: 3-isopropylmalate dehydratase [Chloroflexi bacterium]|nr:3-isopropylmalate dehydratase [Chloroflexota bacterium]